MTTTSCAPPVWQIRELSESSVRRLETERGLPEIAARILVARGVTEPEDVDRFLQPSLMALHDPAGLPDMEAATKRLVEAIRQREQILVHGDYDVDGVIATSLLIRLFQELGARVDWHIPNRFTDGYAFGAHSVAKARGVEAKVVVSVDNGTSSVETIRELAELGIETIVTDHHEPPLGELPPATAIVNPKLKTSRYPFSELCGAAVAFKLAWGICQEFCGSRKVSEELRGFLMDAMSYVAIATICDVVPLVGENRILARHGLRALEVSGHPGLRALLRVAGIGGRRLYGDDVGYQLGPRINASGRLGSAETAVKLLLCVDPSKADELARELDQLNVRRKEIEAELIEKAVEEAEKFSDPQEWPVMVVAGEGWHRGVIGIVASRLVGRYGRPAVVVGLENGVGHGSARSVPGVSILELLRAGEGLLTRYGGHAAAAGLEVRADDVGRLRELVNERAREVLGDGGLPQRELLVDGVVDFEGMNEELMRVLDRLEPFGEENPAPVFLSKGLRLARAPRLVGADRSHLMLQLRKGGTVLKGMAFGMGAREGELMGGVDIDVVYTPKWNVFRGETTLEVVVADFRVGG